MIIPPAVWAGHIPAEVPIVTPGRFTWAPPTCPRAMSGQLTSEAGKLCHRQLCRPCWGKATVFRPGVVAEGQGHPLHCHSYICKGHLTEAFNASLLMGENLTARHQAVPVSFQNSNCSLMPETLLYCVRMLLFVLLVSAAGDDTRGRG